MQRSAFLLVFLATLAQTCPILAAPQPAGRTSPAGALESSGTRSTSPGIASPCTASVVAEVRRDAVYVATGAGCALTRGATLTSEKGATLEVTDAGTSWARLTMRDGPVPVAGQRLDIASVPSATADANVRPTGSRAGPGAISRVAPPELFEEASRTRNPRAYSTTAGARVTSARTSALEVRGRLGAGVTGVADLSDRGAGWWRPFLDSSVDLDRHGSVAWTYRHRIRGQWRFDGRSSSQPWDGDEPRLLLRELRAGAAFLDRRLTVGLGRLSPDGVAGADSVDGAVLEGQVADRVHVGAFGGILPHPTSLMPDLHGTGFGAWIRGAGRAGMAQLSGSLLLSGTTWKGRLDETRADARLSVAAGRAVSAWALARLDLWPTERPGNRPVADLSRLLVGLRGRPAARLDLGARFSWHRWTASRRAQDLWGVPFAAPATQAVGLAGLDLRWEPVDGLDIRLEGDADVTGPAETGWAVGGAVAYTIAGPAPCRFELRYRYEDGDLVRGHHAGAEVRLPFHDAVSLDAGYRFSRYESIASDPSLEHDARLGLLAQVHRKILVFAGAEWMQGHDVMALFASGRVDWRF